jgi:hypothetical protein
VAFLRPIAHSFTPSFRKAASSPSLLASPLPT